MASGITPNSIESGHNPAKTKAMNMNSTWTRSGMLKAGGKSLEYACVGPPPQEAPTLVLLHEGLGSVGLWRNFPKTLSEATGFGVFSYSRAGYGHSDLADLPRPLDYLAREACDILPDVLDIIGAKQAVLLGHSDGATIAAMYAGSVTSTCLKGIILIAPHFFIEGITHSAVLEAKEAFDNGNLRDRLAMFHRDPDNTFRGWNDSWLNPEYANWNISEVIDTINMPVLAIQGRDDEYGTLAQVDVLTSRARVPVDTLILDDCQHSPHFEQAGQVLSRIAVFCSNLG